MAGDVKHELRKKPQPLSKQVKHLNTSAILLGNISFGCAITSFPPVLDNIAWRYKSSIEDMSIVFTWLTIMYCIGAIICGFVSKYMNRQLMAVFSLFIIALSMYMTPYCPTKTLFFVIGGILGFACGSYGASQIVWIIEIWQQKSGPFIQAQHFTYAVGSIIPSVVMAPFLHKHVHGHENDIDLAPTEQSTIHIPFLIIGTFNALAFLYQLFLFIFYRYHRPPMYADVSPEPVDNAENNKQRVAETQLTESLIVNNVEREQDRNNNLKSRISKRKIQLVAFAMLFLGAHQAMELSTTQFLPIFGQHSNLKLSESAAAHVLTGLLIMYAVGRLLGLIIISKIQPEQIIVVNIVLITTGNTILSVWASGSMTMFWMGSMIIGLGFANMFPTFYTFIEKHLIISGNVASCTLVFGTTLSATYPIILGKVIEHHAVVLTYTNFASIVVSVIVMFWGYNLTRKTVTRE